jgi:type IV secretion system protein VirB10
MNAVPESPDDPVEEEAIAARPSIRTGPTAEPERIDGDRGIASVNQRAPLQSRLANLFAVALMATLGFGFLGWYYTRTWARSSEARATAQQSVRSKAQGDMALPPLGRVTPPRGSAADASTPVSEVLPPLPDPATAADAGAAPTVNASTTGTAATRPTAYARRLSGPVFESADASGSAPASSALALMPALGDGGSAESASTSQTVGSNSALGALLQPTLAPAARSSLLPTRQLLLPKGAFIDCTLETAIDSSLPGLTTCLTATDTFGADGTVVLLERGTKLIGETRGEVQQGQARLFVLWTEARTPTGVIVPLASPGTDELGRSGLPGEVNRHFMQRFGAAILVSVIDGAVQAAAQSGSNEGTVIYNPSRTEDVMTEVLKSTISIPPTLTKHNGDRMQILVARDLDFRSVYALRPRPAS